jgi:hypothetical protein
MGKLKWLACQSRPDLAFAVGVLSTCVSCPRKPNWVAVMHVLRYLVGTQELGLVYGTGDGFRVYCGSDWCGDYGTNRSTSGFVGLLHGGPIFWRSTKQRTVAVSSAEAEYVAAWECTRRVVAVTSLLGEFGVQQLPVPIMGDNQSCLALVANPMCTHKTKHIRRCHHFVREKGVSGEVVFRWVPSGGQWADCLTKPTTAGVLSACCGGLGMG